MEVNARVQVEHPVSEYVSGIDIIKEQILACGGNSLGINQKDINLYGYAMECRINASAPGKVKLYLPPGGFNVRVDSFLYSGCEVSPFYDALLAKLIVHAQDRQEGISRMQRALSEFILEGVPTNIDEQKNILAHPLFKKAKFGTDILSQILMEDKS